MLAGLLSAGLLLGPGPARAEAEDASEDAGSIGIRLIEVDEADDARSKAYLVDHVEPGAVVERRIEVGNASTERQRIDVYAAAAAVEDDAFTAAEGRGGNDLASWTRVEKPSVELAPGESEAIDVRIDVPEDASRGERYAAILAEVSAVDGDGIHQVHRVGVRVYLSVGPGGEPPTDFRIDGLEVSGPSPEGWPVLVAHVTNTGERALDPSGSVALEYEGGTLSAGPFAFRSGMTIAPGDSGQVGAELHAPLEGGRWRATATLSSGDVERTAEEIVDIPSGAADAAPARPWVAIVIGAIAAALAAMALVFWVARRNAASHSEVR